MSRDSGGDRRRYPRFAPRDWLVACVDSSREIVVGTVVDISRGGVSFQYVGDIYDWDMADGNNCYVLDLVTPSSNLIIRKIPCQVVYDMLLKREHVISFLKMKRCGIMFCDLSKEKQEEVEVFLKQVV